MSFKYILVLLVISAMVGGWIVIYSNQVEEELDALALSHTEITIPPKNID